MALRYGFFAGMIGAVVGLSLMAWRVSVATEALEAQQGAPRPSAAGAVGMAQSAAAAARLQQASTVANVYLAQTGTLEGFTAETLRQLDPTIDPSVVLAWTAPADACFQTGSGTATVHVLVSAGAGPPLAGPC